MAKKIDPKLYQPGNYSRFLDLSVRAGEGEGESFELSFSSELPYERWGITEVLLHTPQAVDMARLQTAGALLFDHGYHAKYGRMPIGKIESARLDVTCKRCLATITFDEEDEDAVKVRRKVERGMIKGVSVGYRVMEWLILQNNETSADGRFKGPMALAVKWEPYEISIVAVPADPSVGVGRGVITNQEEVIEMDGEIMRNEATPGVVAPDEERVRAALEKQRRNAAAISKRCQLHGIDPSDMISRGLTEEQASVEILRQLEVRNPPNAGSVMIVAEEQDKYRAAASDAILLRGGLRIDKPAEGARGLQGVRLRDLAIDCLARSGASNARIMRDEDLFRAVMTPDSVFVGIVTDAVRKSMATAYTAADTTFNLWTSEGSNPDFKPKRIVQIGEAGELEEVTENGELKMDHPTTDGVTSVLATFGKTFGFTRKAMIDDDIDMLSKLPAAYVRAAQRGVNRAVYKILQQNPTLADGHPLFSAEHNNLGAAAKPSVASYQEAMGKMMHQKNLRGIEKLNIRPKYIICDPLQFAEHSAMLTSLADPKAPNSGAANPFKGTMELIMDADLLAATNGVLPYFFAADPSSCGTIEVAYLNGVREPQLEYQVGFDYLGIRYRIIHDRGVTLLDHRGLYKNPGSAT